MQLETVMQPAAHDDRAFTGLLARNLKIGGDLAATVRWQYLEGPSAPGHVFLLRGDDAAVGCAGVTTRELWYRGHELRAAHFANFAIDRAHRTGLAALTLQRAVKRHVDTSFDLAFGLPNRHATPVYCRIGYTALGKMARYVRVLRHGPYLERYLRGAGIAGPVIDRLRIPRDGEPVVFLGDVDARFDRLWLEARHEIAIASRRDAAFLRWRFLRKPDEQHVVAVLAPRHALTSYAILRGEPGGMAEIADAFGSIAALDRLFAAVIPALYRRGHTAVSFLFAGDPRVRALLARHGFVAREADRTAILHVTPRCRLPLRDLAGWYLTELDADT